MGKIDGRDGEDQISMQAIEETRDLGAMMNNVPVYKEAAKIIFGEK